VCRVSIWLPCGPSLFSRLDWRRSLAQLQRANEEAARAAAEAARLASEAARQEARARDLRAIDAQAGHPTVNLDAVSARDDVSSFVDSFLQ
jgi:hypothetical protein